MKSYNLKVVYALILAVILIIAASVTLYLQENKNSTNQPPEGRVDVKITDFSVDDNWGALAGVTFGCGFNLTIENMENNSINDLTLKLTITQNGIEEQYGTYFKGTYENNSLKEPLSAGEVRACDGVIMTTIGSGPRIFNVHSNETSIVASVILNGTVLDEGKNV